MKEKRRSVKEKSTRMTAPSAGGAGNGGKQVEYMQRENQQKSGLGKKER